MPNLELENLILHNFPEIIDVRLHDFFYIKSEKLFYINLLVGDKNKADKDKMENYLKEALQNEVDLKITQSFIDEDYLRLRISRFFGENGGYLKPALTKLDYDVKKIDDNNYTLVFYGNKSFCGYMEGSLKDSLVKYLYRCFICNFEINTVEIFDEVKKISTKEINLRAVEVKNPTMYIGKPIEERAGFIVDIKGAYDNAVIAGKIINLTERTRKNPPKQNARNKNPIYFTFSVQDCSGTFSCVMFPSFSNTDLVRKMNNVECLLSGKISYDKFGELKMMVDKVTLCEILTKTPPKAEEVKEEPVYYTYVSPEPLKVYEQDNMLLTRKKLDLSKFLGKTIVVFDLETTGLDREKSKIVEIGAVKIVDGEFTEKFSTLINPEIPIPKETTKINNITDDMVKNCPTWEKVVADFYKFSFGAILCGHNAVDFDMPILNNQAKKCGYNFPNKVIDTCILSRSYVRGVRDNRLSTLCSKYNVVNENAHRAYEDAISTGRVLINMVNEYPIIEV